MRRIRIFDTTLRDGEQSPGCSMDVKQKLELALQLERLGVDTIEAGFAKASDKDFEAVRTVGESIKNARVASLARLDKDDIDRAHEALKTAANPMLHVFIATSDLHMQYKLRMTREQVLSAIETQVTYGRTLFDVVEFSCEDGSRSDPDFLIEAVTLAVRCGASIINIPDTVGYATPQEMYDLIKRVRTAVGEDITLSAHCHDDLGLGVACSLAAIKAGADQIECTINGIGERAGNAALEEIVMGLYTRPDYYQCECGIVTRQIYRTSRLLSTITGAPVPPNKAVVGANAFAHESGIHQHGVLAERTTYEIMTPESIGIPQNKMVLGKHSGKHAFNDRLVTLGYILNDEQLARAFERFKQLCDKKKTVTDRDIEALISDHEHKHATTANYISFVINSGSTITSTANVKLEVDGVAIEKVATGDGPVDACFKAIDKIVKRDVHLINYTIQSVTDGVDALGEVVVKVRTGANVVTGRGLSTDIIEASIKAYLNAVNKV